MSNKNKTASPEPTKPVAVAEDPEEVLDSAALGLVPLAQAEEEVKAAQAAAGTITMDVTQLSQMIAQAVAAAMAGHQAPQLDAQAIGLAVAQGIAANTRPKIGIGQYEPHSPFHPGLKATKPKLLRQVFQNGSLCRPDTLHDIEIEMLNRITHSGRYLERKVEVRFDDTNADEVIYINFDNRRDAMSDLKSLCRNFGDMLLQIVEIQEVEDKDSDARADRRAARR